SYRHTPPAAPRCALRPRTLAPLPLPLPRPSDPPPPALLPLALHDALPIFPADVLRGEVLLLTQEHHVFTGTLRANLTLPAVCPRSEEHTSELQSRFGLVCRPLLEQTNGTIVRMRAASSSSF